MSIPNVIVHLVHFRPSYSKYEFLHVIKVWIFSILTCNTTCQRRQLVRQNSLIKWILANSSLSNPYGDGVPEHMPIQDHNYDYWCSGAITRWRPRLCSCSDRKSRCSLYSMDYYLLLYGLHSVAIVSLFCSCTVSETLLFSPYVTGSGPPGIPYVKFPGSSGNPPSLNSRRKFPEIVNISQNCHLFLDWIRQHYFKTRFSNLFE